MFADYVQNLFPDSCSLDYRLEAVSAFEVNYV